jgi:hypothetical protein
MLSKILNFFNPKEKEEEQEHPETTIKPDNVVDFRAQLFDALVKNLRPLSYSDSITDIFVLWVTDKVATYQLEVRKPDFENAFHLALENANLIAVSKAIWQIKTDDLPGKANFQQIIPGVYLQIQAAAAHKSIFTKAKISLVNDIGSLMQDVYILDSSKQVIFNIGRGEVVETDRGYRTNYIVVRDNDPDARKQVQNSVVSRAQANIVFVENKGFYLQAMPGGSRTATGGRTRIVRGENELIDVENLNFKYPLQNGDMIELGKTILLKFNELEIKN